MFEQNHFYFTIGWGVFAFVLLFVYLIVSRNLPQKRKSKVFGKLGCAALVPYIFWLSFITPFVSSYSRTDSLYFDEKQTERKTETVADLANRYEHQARQIQLLKIEAERLRNDARNISEHSRIVMMFLGIAGLTLCFNIIFRKSVEKEDEE